MTVKQARTQMSGGLLPPFGEPDGERADDATVLDRFAGGAVGGVYSSILHIEGATLMVSRDVAAALRLGPRSALVRIDLPDEQQGIRPVVERALAARGMSRLDDATLFATPIAMQVLGLRMSTWDLWGADLDEAFVDLRAAAAGEWGSEFFPEGPAMP
ncbi:MAG: hypothetical protein ACRDY5_04195, partial [Acidimicrobiales bacterium]